MHPRPRRGDRLRSDPIRTGTALPHALASWTPGGCWGRWRTDASRLAGPRADHGARGAGQGHLPGPPWTAALARTAVRTQDAPSPCPGSDRRWGPPGDTGSGGPSPTRQPGCPGPPERHGGPWDPRWTAPWACGGPGGATTRRGARPAGREQGRATPQADDAGARNHAYPPRGRGVAGGDRPRRDVGAMGDTRRAMGNDRTRTHHPGRRPAAACTGASETTAQRPRAVGMRRPPPAPRRSRSAGLPQPLPAHRHPQHKT